MSFLKVGAPLIRVAMPLALPPVNLLMSSPGKIDFTYYLDPFVQLLAKAGMGAFLASYSLAFFTYRTLTAAEVIFSRILHKPDFNPYDNSFKERIQAFEDRVDVLQDRLWNLEQKFWQEHLIARDLKELHTLHFEIQEILRQLEFYNARLAPRNQPLAIQDQLASVRDSYRDLEKQLDGYCQQKGSDIINLVYNVVNTFTKGGINLPDDIYEQLLQIYDDFDKVIGYRAFHLRMNPDDTEKMTEIANHIQSLEASESNKMPVDSSEPLRLKNIGNSCYMDSVLQALLCSDKIAQQFKRSIPSPERPVAPKDDGSPDYKDKVADHQKQLTKYKKDLEEYTHRLKIQQELLQLINVQQLNVYTQLELILFLHRGPDLVRLRKAIFESGFHHEFEMSQLTRQLDAASMMEMFIDQFLSNCKFEWEEHAESKDFPGLDFVGRKEKISSLQIPLRAKRENQTLMKLIQFVVHKHPEREADPVYQRHFDPKDGVDMMVDDKAGKLIKHHQADQSRAIAPKKVGEFIQSYRFKDLPPILTLHFKRFKQTGKKQKRLVKDDSPVILPEDGIVDLSKYYDAPQGESNQARYKIKSYVVHSGGLHGGHYVAYVEKNGEYYFCDDADPKFYKKISEKDFFSRKDAYLVVLERLPDEAPTEDEEENQSPVNAVQAPNPANVGQNQS